MTLTKSTAMIVASALALAACAGEESAGNPENYTVDAEVVNNATGSEISNDMAGAGMARAMLATADGAARGEGTATATPEGLRISITATGLPEGEHGAHIHMTGKCEAPAFESAGPHWNPTNKEHGSENPQGSHAGDMPNLTVAADGSGTLQFLIPGAVMTGGGVALLDADGAALVIHEGADDMRTDPSGDSGGRIACGVFNAG